MESIEELTIDRDRWRKKYEDESVKWLHRLRNFEERMKDMEELQKMLSYCLTKLETKL